MHRRNAHILPSLVFLAAVLFAMIPTAEGAVKIESRWRDREVFVDGSIDEWKGLMTYVEGEALSLGVLNDEERIYLCILSRDPRVIRRILDVGLALRLDPKGGEPFAIQYPVGMRGRGEPPESRTEARDPDGAPEIPEQSLETFLLLGPGREERQELPAGNAAGIELRASIDGGEFVYEIALPLERAESFPYAVGAAPGARLSLLFETPEPEISKAGGRPDRGKSGGMIPGARRRAFPRGGPGGLSKGSMGPGRPEPVRVKAKVRLAADPVRE